jgi:hypothetical protein
MFSKLVVFLASFSAYVNAMYETDILGFQIANEIKGGHEVSPQYVKGWLGIFPGVKLDSEADLNYQNAQKTPIEEINTDPLVELIDEEIEGQKNIESFHILLQNLDPNTRSIFIGSILSYIF